MEVEKIPIEEVEERLNQLPTIIVDGYDHPNHLSLDGFISEFILHLNRIYTTSVADGSHTDAAGKHRSIGDIYRICKRYYPNTTLVEVNDILNDLWAKRQIKTLKCPHIQKRVYFERAHAHDGETYGETLKMYYGFYQNRNEYGWMIGEDYFNYKPQIHKNGDEQ